MNPHVSHSVWPPLGLVGIVSVGAAKGQHVFLVADSGQRWMLYLEPPWENFVYGSSVFSFDNNIFWSEDAQKITDDWAVEWMTPGSPEELQAEKDLFDVRVQYARRKNRRS